MVRQEFFKFNKILSFNTTYHLIKQTIDYKSLPAKVSQLVIKQVVDNFNYWKKSFEKYQKYPHQYLGCPKIPKYVHFYHNIFNKCNSNKVLNKY